MAARKRYVFLLLALSTLSFIISSSNAADCIGPGAISVYWGQHPVAQDASLQTTCDSFYGSSTLYNIVILESLIVYDNGNTPTLNLTDHCTGTPEFPCSNLEGEIKHCQELGIKVFLSIGQDKTGFTTRDRRSIPSSSPSSLSLLSDGEVTPNLTHYIIENFLKGQPGPLGSVTLDGIDIANVPDSKHLHWDELVRILKAFSNETKLSAAPQCVYPDPNLDAAIKTGLLDYIWVKFFDSNDSCIFSETNPNGFWDAWGNWTSENPNSLIFLGLTTYPDMEGYIEPKTVRCDVLPRATSTSNYGGVMLWDRYGDIRSDYSKKIKGSVGSNTFYSIARSFLM